MSWRVTFTKQAQRDAVQLARAGLKAKAKALIAVITVGWVMKRATLLEQLGGENPSDMDRFLVRWLRWVVPGAVLVAAVWWLLTDVLGAVQVT